MTRKIGIVCCSDGFNRAYEGEIEELHRILADMGIESVISPFLYARDGVASGTAEERAKAVMDFYLDDTIDAICDISGGDIANGILPYLDYSVIAKMDKQFWGYSDLTTVLNAIYARTGKFSVLYQVRNLTYEHSQEQITEIFTRKPDGKAGIGIKNVNDRLRIYFGPGYGLSIDSVPDEGTTVTIRMPQVPADREGDYDKTR